MNVLIGDPASRARARLTSLLGRCASGCRVVAAVGNGCDVVDFCALDAVDLVLMETRMPVMDGLQAAAALAASRCPPAVIFVSADASAAVAAFDVDAVDYLVKPVNPQRLHRAVERARTRLREVHAGTDPAPRAFIGASQRGARLRIGVDEISVLRADAKYVEVVYPGGTALTDESLRAIEARLPGAFLRVHRNALVAEHRLRALRRGSDGRLLLAVDGCGLPVEVSRRHAPRVRALLRGQVEAAPIEAG